MTDRSLADDRSLAEQLAASPRCEEIVAALDPCDRVMLNESLEFWAKPSQRALLPLFETLEYRLAARLRDEHE